MRRASLLLFLAIACSAAHSGRAVAPRPPSSAAEQHAEPIVKQILENVKRIIKEAGLGLLTWWKHQNG